MDQFEKLEGEISDALPKQAKGGTFATADMAILKRALHAYKKYLIIDEFVDDDGQLIIDEENERAISEELAKVANLLHRIGRIA